ncbi:MULTISPECIES: GNAT family N-acetyltransferase [unclassified Paenibacillus]|uniref:GNAT family N-acetyltransferase n=1 Tax=unclassified Paenibacillus TaxID=185978 RepID=UPI002406CAB4|nr:MULTISPECIES: GNAT family N-acetyltransferase [unclassified Paenibacillus]MDF9841007.1 putative GNAT family N-acyltransferase [Paenibacillus sp. PastF-2]MDF9847820.1 putative GNAT family N-acyltransferase [Paenibacillus sp. PastM-2]MDF9854389.1 putative GNAT family N-acyltransferase [Paenibacillus sp. PastF-1]MDH6479440.1 putative GNAT family N-acyltransferase [Paenibacillus sp. PastH-2]MDH6505106.1 putative GNAT family N-acyltransferase [Paenibacillus sp. PastM-3]
MNVQAIMLPEELQAAFSIRKQVFVAEQGVPLADEFDDFDTLDGQCRHVLAYYEGQPVGTGRIRAFEGKGKLERICILAPFRKFGIGKQIIATLEEIAVQNGYSGVKLHGQSQARGFYEKLGYQTLSAEFMEDGIPHFLMTKAISASHI